MSSEAKRDYYETLGVTRDASKDDLRSAYRKLARSYHPDVNKDSEAEQRFKEINEAYQVQRRQVAAQYDALGMRSRRPGGRSGFGFGGFGGLRYL